MVAMPWWNSADAWVRRHADVCAVVVLLAGVAAYGVLYVDFRGPPFEDAAMLMRYAENLAAGHGIVWNVGEAPVDGATDFLFMSSVAGLDQARPFHRPGGSSPRARRACSNGGPCLCGQPEAMECRRVAGSSRWPLSCLWNRTLVCSCLFRNAIFCILSQPVVVPGTTAGHAGIPWRCCGPWVCASPHCWPL